MTEVFASLRRPDYFIVGVARCGTTSLFDALGQHPQIHNSATKEPSFFARDRAPGRQRTMEEYLALFAGAHDEHVAVGEASASYFGSAQAAAEIRAFNPAARIIICLRDPVDRLYSIYHYRKSRGQESAPTFEEALRRESNGDVRALQYVRIAQYGDGIRRFLKSFDRSAIHILLFDDLITRPREVYRDTLAFLGAKPDFAPDVRAANTARAARFPRLQRFLASPPPVVSRLAAVALPRSARQRISLRLRRLNMMPLEKGPIDSAVRQRLVEACRPDVLSVSTMIGQDLSRWLDG